MARQGSRESDVKPTEPGREKPVIVIILVVVSLCSLGCPEISIQGWPRTQGSTCFCLWNAGIKGVWHLFLVSSQSYSALLPSPVAMQQDSEYKSNQRPSTREVISETLKDPVV